MGSVDFGGQEKLTEWLGIVLVAVLKYLGYQIEST